MIELFYIKIWVSTFDEIEARSIVQYLETNINVDQRQLHDVTIESSYEQITWANTKMELISDLIYDVYQVQDYSFNINIGDTYVVSPILFIHYIFLLVNI